MKFKNVYEDNRRAESYARLQFPATYYLAFRDLPSLIKEHVTGNIALDFGCGTGRSSRFLKNLGFNTLGVDISEEMLIQARQLDPTGEYLLVKDGGLQEIRKHHFNLILSAFTFDNIPTEKRKIKLFTELKALLDDGGRIINLVSTPDIYTHEWASFSTRDFPENKEAQNGDTVRIITTAVEDKRPVVDILWSDEVYREVYRHSRLRLIQTHKPLGRKNEPFNWVNETRIAPWAIYILG
jgi:SAM-dependent methyltransferase